MTNSGNKDQTAGTTSTPRGFTTQDHETLAPLIQEETQGRTEQNLRHHRKERRYDDCQFRRTGTDDGESDSQHTEEHEGNGMRTQNLTKFDERRYSPRDSPLRLDYIDNRRKRRERTNSYSGDERQKSENNTALRVS